MVVGSSSEHQFAETTEVAANMDIETGLGNNGIDPSSKTGIDHLLRASTITGTETYEEIEYVLTTNTFCLYN